ncbi:dihydroneopterin aldolase [Hydrogenimonas sp.]
MTIHLENLEFDTILGILETERTAPQRVRVDAAFTYRYTPEKFLDYAAVARSIQTIMVEERFELIEEALEALFGRLKTLYPQIETATIKICKPDILPNCRVCVEDSRSFL